MVVIMKSSYFLGHNVMYPKQKINNNLEEHIAFTFSVKKQPKLLPAFAGVNVYIWMNWSFASA